MAKMSILEMTQNILSAMNSDEVNSISDTVESQQVADEIKTTFEELYTNRDMPEREGIITLEATGDLTRPNTLRLPSATTRIKWVKYLDFQDSNPRYREIQYLHPEEFLERVVEQGASNFSTYTTVPLLTTSPVIYTIPTNRAPSYYTIFNNDDILVFDAYDSAIETNLTGANSLAWGINELPFVLEDDYVPNLPENLFPHFLAEAKSACFINVKETANSKEEQRARRQLVRSQFRLNKSNDERIGVFSGTDFSRKR